MDVYEFFKMGGHGFYIWGSYGTALGLVIIEAVWVAKKHNKAKVELNQMEAEFTRANNQGVNG